MKISVVTISFNQAPYLSQCINSVLKQDYDNFEYIIVDPGSTDGSRELISSFDAKLIKHFAMDEGPSDGLNKGFLSATGDIFYFLNSDDYLEPGAFRTVANAFRKKGMVDIVVGNGYIETGNRKLPISTDCLTYHSMLMRTCRIFQQGTFFTRDIFHRSGGFNIKNRTCWDYELFLRFCELNAVCVTVNSRLATFRQHVDSISGSGRLVQEYQSDLDRIYFELTGKNWGIIEQLRSKSERGCRYLTRQLRRSSVYDE